MNLNAAVDLLLLPAAPRSLELQIHAGAALMGGTSMDTTCAPPWTNQSYPWPLTTKEFNSVLQASFGNDTARVVNAYGPLSTLSPMEIAQRWMNATRDAGVSCPCL